MKVRIWIRGDDGPSHDFELLAAPHIGERVSIAFADRVEDGVVASVDWRLQGIERSTSDLLLEGEPLGSVTVVHVVCAPPTEGLKVTSAFSAVDPAEASLQ